MPAPMGWAAPTSLPPRHQGGDPHGHHHWPHPPHPPPLLAADKQPCALTDWLHGLLEDNPEVPILQVRLHADDVDDVIQACTGRAHPTINKTQRRHVGMKGTTLLFAAHKRTTKKAWKDKSPFKHPLLDSVRYVVDSKPAMSLPNHSLTSHSPYGWKPELLGLTTPVLMESEVAVLPPPPHVPRPAAHWDKRTGEASGTVWGPMGPYGDL